MKQRTLYNKKHPILKGFGLLLLLVITGLVFFSCDAHQYITLYKDGSGRFTLSLKLGSQLSEYLLDIGEAAGYYEDRKTAAIFDNEKIKQAIQNQKGLSLVSCTSKTRDSLDLTVGFSNINGLLTSQNFFKKSGMITLTKHTPNNYLNLHFDKKIFELFLEEMGMFSSEDYEYFLPQEGETKESYYKTLDFSLENGSALLKKSIISIDISVPGSIEKHNGILIGENTVRYTLPLEYIIFPDTPRNFYIQYK